MPRGPLRFFLGHCLDVLAALPRRSVAVMVTSPPYNLGIRNRSYGDTVPRAGYLEWTGRWVAAAREVLETEGRSSSTRRWATTSRSTAPGSSTTATSSCFTSPVRARTPLDRRATGGPYQDASNIDRWQNDGRNLRGRGNTWFIPYETIQSRDKDRPHPRDPFRRDYRSTVSSCTA